MYNVTQKLQFYTFFYPLNVLIPSSPSQQCNRLTIFWLAEKTRLKTPIKRPKIKLLYLLAPSLFLLNRANCSACVDKFPTCSWNRPTFMKWTADLQWIAGSSQNGRQVKSGNGYAIGFFLWVFITIDVVFFEFWNLAYSNVSGILPAY
jgi:hypothetical protein